MERAEPAFKPEWLKSANGVLTSNGGSNHHAGASSNSDEFSLGVSSRNRLSVVDRERNLSPSLWRSSSSNGSRTHEKDVLRKLRGYSSFGRSNRVRDREDFDFWDGESKSGTDGFHDHSVSFVSSRSENDALRESRSVVSGKGPGNNSINGVRSKGSIVGASFDEEFPTLGSEEKTRRSDVGRVPSLGINTRIQSIPLGFDSRDSVLAALPTTIGANVLGLSSISRASSASQVAAPASASTGLSTNTGLNMAETVAQAPSRVRTLPQLSSDTQRIEELTRRQCEQLIPVTPSMPRTSVSNSSDKSKNKISRSGDSSTSPKTAQKLSPQHVTSCLHSPFKPDFSGPSQLGSFQVLNRERNGLSPTARVNPNISKAASPVGLAASASSKSPNLRKPKGDGKVITMTSTQGSFGERRLKLQAKDRLEFFKSLRSKTINTSSVMPEPGSLSNSSTLVDSSEQAVNNGKDGISDSELKCSENGNCVDEDKDACEESENLLHDNEEANTISEPVDPEEEAFLRSLGWDQNAAVDALTEEEIDAFNVKYKERGQPSKLSN